MEINTNNQVQGPANAPKAGEVKHENKEASGHPAARSEESPDYHISLSEDAKKAVTDSTGPQDRGQLTPGADLSEAQALEVASQTSEKLAQTNAAISNQAIQRAVDLFA